MLLEEFAAEIARIVWRVCSHYTTESSEGDLVVIDDLDTVDVLDCSSAVVLPRSDHGVDACRRR